MSSRSSAPAAASRPCIARPAERVQSFQPDYMVGFFVIQDKFGRCVRSAGLIGQNACLDVLSGSARISCVGARFVLIEAGAVLVGDAERLAYVLPAVLPGLPAGLLDLPAGERVDNRPAGRFGIFATLVVLPADRLDFANRARRPSLGIRITPFRAQPEDRTVFFEVVVRNGYASSRSASLS